MPHQCVRCNAFYEDGTEQILKGCPCGGKLFFYIKKDKLKEAKKAIVGEKLSTEEKEQVEKDVFEMMGKDIDEDEPVVLDFESVRILKPGKYELDLVHLFNKDPLVFKLEDGKYMIDLDQSFDKLKKDKKR